MNKNSAIWSWTKTRSAKIIFSVSRWLHIYLSTALFSLLIFFCVTGIFLNHLDWIKEKPNQNIETVDIPIELIVKINEAENPPIELIKKVIDQKFDLKDPRKINIDLELQEITLDYPLPAGYAFITLLIEDGVMEIEHEKGHWLSLMNDLHKGRHSGEKWSWVIDISAILIIFFALTGLIILLQQSKRRATGIFLILLGTITPILIYLFFVPKFIF